MSLTTAPSSADILQFDPNQPANRPEHNARGLKFAQVSKAWLLQWQADDRLTHADQALVTQIYAHFNWTHFEKSGELLAWPSWETIAAEARLSEPSIRRGCQKLERLHALTIIHGGRDPKTGWRLHNKYRAIAAAPPVTVTGGHRSGFSKSTGQGDGRLSDREVVNLSKKDQGFSQGTLEGRSLPRGPSAPKQARNQEGPRAPPDNPLPASPTTEDVPRGKVSPVTTGGGCSAGDGRYVAYTSPEMAVVERYERRTGKKFPRDRRGGWLLTPAEWAHVAADGGPAP
jgi:hypothetical protein